MAKEFKFKGSKYPKVKCPDGETLKFALDRDDLADPDEFESFIKDTEKMVRSDPRYKEYKAALIEAGFNKDVFQSGISLDKFPNISLELHHGPIFNLFEICAIVTDHILSKDEKVTSFDIANIVIEEHRLNHIQIVMGLTKTNHQAVHDGKMFVHIKQSIGDLLAFIKEYKRGIKREHLYTLEKYLSLCEKYEATDNDYLTKICSKILNYVQKNDNDK